MDICYLLIIDIFDFSRNIHDCINCNMTVAVLDQKIYPARPHVAEMVCPVEGDYQDLQRKVNTLCSVHSRFC
jgi:hypothetical protein